MNVETGDGGRRATKIGDESISPSTNYELTDGEYVIFVINVKIWSLLWLHGWVYLWSCDLLYLEPVMSICRFHGCVSWTFVSLEDYSAFRRGGVDEWRCLLEESGEQAARRGAAAMVHYLYFCSMYVDTCVVCGIGRVLPRTSSSLVSSRLSDEGECESMSAMLNGTIQL